MTFGPNSLLRPLGFELRRTTRRRAPNSEVVSLKSKSATRGRALLSYVLDPFKLTDSSQASKSHTHHWESLCIANCLLGHGLDVDVIHYNDTLFVPTGSYDFLISARTNLERLAMELNDDCVKVAHLDTAHWLRNNTNAMQRLLDLQQRRGVSLGNKKFVEENRAIEVADIGTVLGNSFTMQSYEFANKPLHRTRISVPQTYEFSSSKNYRKAKNSFVWFGSAGFVHKGLDLVLEAFAEMPENTLHVCGPLAEEPEFLAAYSSLLEGASNIDLVGWVDVDGKEFKSLCDNSIAIVYPSCSEGGGGSVISCMHAGLIPIVSEETSVDVGFAGVVLSDSSVLSIIDAVRTLQSEGSAALETRARETWTNVRSLHSQDGFAREYQQFVTSELNL